MIFKFLSQDFFNDYPEANFPELMTKPDRPYVLAIIDIDNLKFAIPLRSGIKHNFDVLWTDKANKCGLDFTKAILILDDKYIDYSSNPIIRSNEYKHLLGKDQRVKEKMEKSIKNYFKAKSNLSVGHNQTYCKCSSLQYFEDYIKEP